MAVLCCLALEGTAGHAADPACTRTRREPYAPWVFLGYACQGACLKQKAGFAWAEAHGIGNVAACPGRDSAFGEGCRAHAEFTVTAEQAGFEWARENELADACECGGAGSAFEAGCEAYLRAAED
jgi:hypothetical protein